MRYLTVKREKRFVACLGTLHVYIENPAAPELEINGVGCQKLGDLKNGEEKIFFIGEEEARVFVIADKLSKNWYSEFYRIPAGSESIYLSGRNYYDPTAGNPFRFNGNDTAEVAESRKKGAGKGRIWFFSMLAIGIILGFIIGFFNVLPLLFAGDPEPKTFTSDGLTIVLTDKFEEIEIQGYNVSYASNNVAVFALKEDYSMTGDDFGEQTLTEYANLLLEVNELSETSDVKTEDGLTYFEYTVLNEADNNEYTYLATVHKSDNAFWFLTFATKTKQYQKYKPDCIEWAKSVSVS